MFLLMSSAVSPRSSFALLLPNKDRQKHTCWNTHENLQLLIHSHMHAEHTCLPCACTHTQWGTDSDTKPMVKHASDTGIQFMWLNEQAVGWISSNRLRGGVWRAQRLGGLQHHTSWLLTVWPCPLTGEEALYTGSIYKNTHRINQCDFS